MKKVLGLITFLVLFGIGAVYFSTPQGKAGFWGLIYYYPCAEPVTYRIGSIDSRFAIDNTTFLADLKQAATIWNSAYGKTVLSYNPDGKIAVNMIYDQRQLLDSQIQTLNQSVTEDKSNLEPQIDQYKALSQDFETKMQNLNQQISYWNSQGGAPPDEYNKLTTEQQALQKEADQLNAMGKSLNQSTSQYNGKIQDLNQTINNFNQTLSQKPEEGVFDPQKSEIDVYFDNSQAELIHTLAHEMGHSLGLGHNQGTNSIMYPHTTDTTKASLLDIEALQKACTRQNRFTIFAEKLQRGFKNLMSHIKTSGV